MSKLPLFNLFDVFPPVLLILKQHRFLYHSPLFFLPSPCWETRARTLWDFHASVRARMIWPSRSKRQSRPWQSGSTIQGGIPKLLTSLIVSEALAFLNVAIVQQALKNLKRTVAHVKYNFAIVDMPTCCHTGKLDIWMIRFFQQTQRIKNKKLACPGHLWACVECCAPLSA